MVNDAMRKYGKDADASRPAGARVRRIAATALSEQKEVRLLFAEVGDYYASSASAIRDPKSLR